MPAECSWFISRLSRRVSFTQTYLHISYTCWLSACLLFYNAMKPRELLKRVCAWQAWHFFFNPLSFALMYFFIIDMLPTTLRQDFRQLCGLWLKRGQCGGGVLAKWVSLETVTSGNTVFSSSYGLSLHTPKKPLSNYTTSTLTLTHTHTHTHAKLMVMLW